MLTRRDLMSSLVSCVGFRTADVLRRAENVDLAALAAQVNQDAVDYESGAESCAALMALLGMDSSFAFKSTEDLCRMVLAVDQLLCASRLVKGGYPVCDFYGDESGLLSLQQLAERIPQRLEAIQESTEWRNPHVQQIMQVLETADALLIDEFVRLEEKRFAHNLPL